jgi:hypothetical protein
VVFGFLPIFTGPTWFLASYFLPIFTDPTSVVFGFLPKYVVRRMSFIYALPQAPVASTYEGVLPLWLIAVWAVIISITTVCCTSTVQYNTGGSDEGGQLPMLGDIYK